MSIIKKYITWNRFIVHPDFRIDPKDAIKMLWSKITFSETGYGNTEDDKRFIGIIEYDDSVISEETFDKFMKNFSYHCFTEISIQKAVSLCISWYGEYFELDTDRFTLIDSRPISDF